MRNQNDYPEDLTPAARAATFEASFGRGAPTHLSRAPGRVNLIGEHTDYNGLPVFPMALRQEVRIFFRSRNDGRVRVVNEAAEFEPRTFDLSGDIPRNSPGDWANYLQAPSQALVRRLGPLRGLDALVVSTVPVASGLSSSSALVIAFGQALLAANEIQLPVLEMAEEMARAERYTGTQGGGMDQAIALGSRAGHASRIEFDPLRMFATPLPPGWHFVVAHTLVRAEKSGAAQAAYNDRSRSCREALTSMRESLRRAGFSDASALTYPRLLTRFPLRELLERGAAALSEGIFPRFRHVLTEAARVYEAERAMREGNLLTFGLLMDASHESLREDYHVSSPELDRLVQLARDGGAAGARLTGAGFGGCIVALTDTRHLEGVLESLERGYHRRRKLPGPLAEVLFVAEAAGGATVVVL